MSVATSSFFSTYAQLINLAPDAPSDAFYGTDDYNKIDTLGPSLPKLPYVFPQASDAISENEDVVTVIVKSIKPPFKFSTLLNGIPLGYSIYKVKTKLVEDVDVLKNAGSTPGDLKVMIKAKVVSDATVLSSLISGDAEISFTVMVSAPKPKAVDPAEEVPVANENATVSVASWQKIYDILVADLGDVEAKAALEKFRNAL
ncbi:CIC11C00000002685 [Sungouiella intermedia]|uniref:CIC11C00000002685 n=1 Tax=Sungouiella intermedia TaxID=45354 RepID=A0A1L0BZV4_9ASCO|nr:CIC11C00000002685 [[Candida] intermedia]